MRTLVINNTGAIKGKSSTQIVRVIDSVKQETKGLDFRTWTGIISVQTSSQS